MDEMNISFINDKMFMTHDKYKKKAIESNLNMIFTENPHLINSLNRSHNHPLIRKSSHIVE